MGRKSEKYETIYEDKTEDELLDEVRGNVTSGTCPNCGGDNTLVCEGALKMKPLQRERWETVFDRKFV